MDQVTQAVLGGAAAQAVFPRALGGRAWMLGTAAAFVPDADMLFAPLADPLFPIEVHRTFSHSLIAVPFVAALTLLVFLPFRRFRTGWKVTFGAAFLGALTHAPLDACTSYGTMLLWPFSDTWVAWDVMAIIDPVFTLVLLVGLVWAARRRSAGPAVIALAIALFYVGLGHVQRERALDVQRTLAEARGHTIDHGRVLAGPGSFLVWRSVYRDGETIHADIVRLLPFASPDVIEGGSVTRTRPRDLPDAVPDPQGLRSAFERFHAFADGFTARAPANPDVVSDVRYSLSPGFDPIWGIRVVEGEAPTWHMRELGGNVLGRLAARALGTESGFRPLSAVLGDAAP